MRKSLAKNSIYNVIYKGFTAFFPLITTSYISRTLLVDGVGKVSYASAIVSYFVIIASLGLPQYGIRVIAQNHTKEDRARSFSELFLINFCSTLICVCAYYSLVNLWDYFSEKQLLLNVMGIQLILNIFNIDWFYQGIEEYQYITTRSIIIKVISFILMLIFVRDSSDYIIYGFILSMATAGNYIINVWHLRNKIRISFNGVNIQKHMSPVLIMLVTSLATEVYTMLDTVMLEHFHGDVYVGYYSNSVKIVRLVHTLAIALVTPFYPRISAYLKEKKDKEYNKLLTLGTQVILIIAIPCVFGIELLSDRIVMILFGNTFSGSVLCLRILSPLILIFSLAYFLGHIVLLATANEKKILIATLIGAVLNFCMNCVLIPVYRHYGAAIASVMAETTITIILVSFARGYFKLQLKMHDVGEPLLCAIVMSVMVYFSRLINVGSVIGGLISVMVGGITYFLMLLILKNDIALQILKTLKNRMGK